MFFLVIKCVTTCRQENTIFSITFYIRCYKVAFYPILSCPYPSTFCAQLIPLCISRHTPRFAQVLMSSIISCNEINYWTVQRIYENCIYLRSIHIYSIIQSIFRNIQRIIKVNYTINFWGWQSIDIYRINCNYNINWICINNGSIYWSHCLFIDCIISETTWCWSIESVTKS